MWAAAAVVTPAAAEAAANPVFEAMFAARDPSRMSAAKVGQGDWAPLTACLPVLPPGATPAVFAGVLFVQQGRGCHHPVAVGPLLWNTVGWDAVCRWLPIVGESRAHPAAQKGSQK
jgi:hypothetical protein